MSRARHRTREVSIWSAAQAALFFIIGGLVSGAWAAGTTGGGILSMPLGARAMAMGSAYTALADDVSSLYWNPAGVGLLNQSQASFMYNQAIQGMSLNHAAVATPLENGGIGGSLSYLSFGRIEGYTANDQPAGDVSAYAGVATLGAAFYSGQSWAAGVTAKGVQGSLAGVKANGLASDAGVTYVHPNILLDGTLRVAATVRNMGTGLTFIDQRDAFPTEARIGAALVQTLNRKLSVSADIGKARDARLAGYLGAELLLIPAIALRGGWAAGDQTGSGIRAGIGLRVRDFSFDYAYSGFGELGLSNVFEISWRFGAIRPTLSPEERDIYRRAKIALMQQRFGEATLLFNSLIDLEPHFRPAQRYLKVAMKDYETQDQMRRDIEHPHHLAYSHAAPNPKDDPELEDLMQVLTLGEDQPQTAQASTLAPPMPSTIDPAQPLVIRSGEKAP